jgi:hypothetical protein
MSDAREPDRFGRLDERLRRLDEIIAARDRERSGNADSAATQAQARRGVPVPPAPVSEPSGP